MYNHWLDTFLKVAEAGSFTKASEILHVSNTSVMKQINGLEELLAVKLFERSPSGVTLSCYGKYLMKESQKLINQSFLIVTGIKHAADEMKHVIRIGVLPIHPIDDFTRIWHRSPLMNQFTVSIVTYPSDVNAMMPKPGDSINYTDLSFASEANLDPSVPTDLVAFRDYPVSLAVPFSHPLASKKRLTLKDLKGERILLPSRGNPVFANQFAQAMREQHPEIKIDEMPLFYDLELFNRCVEGKRILLSLECWDHVHPEMVNLPVDWDWKLPYGLIYRLDARQEVLEFIEAFKAAMKMDD